MTAAANATSSGQPVDDTKPITAAGWKKAKTHTITLASGAVVRIEIPDLAQLIETGEIPQNLLDIALNTVQTGRVPQADPQLAGRIREFTDMVVLKTVVEPKLTEADLPDLPYEDKDMLVQIAMRDRDLDSEGEHIGGLTKSEKFRRFRGLPSVESALEGV